MLLRDYQTFALRTAAGPETLRSTRLAVLGLGLTGEAGEAADIIKKHVGHKHPLDADKLALELGDLLWYVAVLAEEIGFPLDRIAQMNVDKLRKRYPDGFSPEASMAREDTKAE